MQGGDGTRLKEVRHPPVISCRVGPRKAGQRRIFLTGHRPGADGPPVRLIVLHYHLRPGGIRRIIEQATPHLLRASGLLMQRVTLATGEPADPGWHARFAARLAPVPVDCRHEKSFAYFDEQRLAPPELRVRLRAGLKKLLAGAGPHKTLVW